MSDQVPFSVSIDEAPPTVRVSGDVDIATCGTLTDAVEPLLARAPSEPLVFDFTAVTFMDSSGLAVLLNATNAGHRVVVRGASDVVRRVIDATGLLGVIALEP